MSFKSDLSVYCQKQQHPFPKYTTGYPVGPSNTPIFGQGSIVVGNNKVEITDGTYKKRKELEDALAEKMLTRLKGDETSKLETVPTPINNNLYLIDYDHNGHLKSSLEQGRFKAVIFAAVTFNSAHLPRETSSLKVVKATYPISEIVDHMMTWWACENQRELSQYDKVVVISKDKGLYSLVHILNCNGINAEFATTL